MQKKLGRNTVVLLGVGHTNAHVLRMWKMKPMENAQLVCVSNFPIATYSGMMPGVLAGQYEVPEMEIDLVRLCVSAGARLVLGDVVSIDHQNREILFRDRPPLAFDVLSIGVGSRPTFAGVEIAPQPDEEDSSLVPIKPMQTFLDRLKARFAVIREGGQTPKIAVVGGGIGSIEVAFCLDQRLQTKPESLGFEGEPEYAMSLVTGAAQVGTGLIESTQEKIKQQMVSRSIQPKTGSRVAKIESSQLSFRDGSTLDANVVIWATSAVAPAILDGLDFEKDDKGFLLTRSTLQLKSHDRIFAVGDTGTIESKNLPKAGVYAVRQGPVLWDNIRRVLWKRKLVDYVPQHGFLKLVNTADGKSIAEYGSRSFHARWCWWLKDRIDKKFMRMYQDYSLMEMTATVTKEDQEDAMRCLGCGGKIGSKLLSQVLGELEIPQHDDVIIGLEHPDDAAVVATHDGQVTVTTDFFASPLDDPYLVGRIAMLNSVSDCFVMGAMPTSTLALVELPLGHPRAQMQVMRELMAGAVEELKIIGATIVGGHSIEGPRLTAGFTVLGRQLTDPKTKGMLQVGDQLVLSKPIGSGVLLAALMQGQLGGNAYVDLVKNMLLSNQIALPLIQEKKITAITDVTGFGLAGHLIEMLKASKRSAKIRMSDVTLYPDCQRLIGEGIQSTLAPDNRLVTDAVKFDAEGFSETQIASLFDPQTCGGLLFGVAAENCEAAIGFMVENGFEQATVIGEVVANGPEGTALRVV